MPEITEPVRRIVTTRGGAAVLYGRTGRWSAWCTAAIQARYIPNFEMGAVTYRTLEHVEPLPEPVPGEPVPEHESPGVKVRTHTDNFVKIYVNSVSCATMENDTGDGTESNPFTCLNSALYYTNTGRTSRDPFAIRIWPSEKILGCCGQQDPNAYYDDTIKVQIILTGIVDYKCQEYQPNVGVLLITGNGSTEFRYSGADERYDGYGNRLYDYKVKLHKTIIQNCKINVSGDYCCFCEGSDDSRNEFMLFDNCRMSALNNAAIYDDFWTYTSIDMYGSELTVTGSSDMYDTAFSVKFCYASKFYCSNFLKMTISAADSCSALYDGDGDLYVGYIYRSTVHADNLRLGSDYAEDCEVEINATEYHGSTHPYRYGFDVHPRAAFNRIKDSSVEVNYRFSSGSGKVDFGEFYYHGGHYPGIWAEQSYDSDFTVNLSISGVFEDLGGYGHLGLIAPSLISENCDWDVNVNLSGMDVRYTEDDPWISHTFGMYHFAIDSVNGCAYKNVNISGSMSPPPVPQVVLSPLEYCHSLCWCREWNEGEGWDPFIHIGGGSFAGIVNTNMQDPPCACQVDPY